MSIAWSSSRGGSIAGRHKLLKMPGALGDSSANPLAQQLSLSDSESLAVFSPPSRDV